MPGSAHTIKTPKSSGHYVANYTERMYGCDPVEFMKMIKESNTFQDCGKDMALITLLSDAQCEMFQGNMEESRQMINRVKYLIQNLK